MQIYKALQFPSTNKEKKNPLKKKSKRKKGLIGDKVKIENAELKEIKWSVWNDNREENREGERERWFLLQLSWVTKEWKIATTTKLKIA